MAISVGDKVKIRGLTVNGYSKYLTKTFVVSGVYDNLYDSEYLITNETLGVTLAMREEQLVKQVSLLEEDLIQANEYVGISEQQLKRLINLAQSMQ